MDFSKLYKQFIVKCYLIVIFAFKFAVIGNTQTYRAQFDKINQSECDQHFPFLLSNLGTKLTNDGSQILESYITMYKATKDIKYLNMFITMSKRIMDRRDDNWDNISAQVYGMPYIIASGCTISVSTPQIDPNSKGWTRYEADAGTCILHPHFMESGLIAATMATFIILVQSQETDLQNLPVPTEALSSSIPNSYGSTPVATFNDYIHWLRVKLYETLDWECANHWNNDETGAGWEQYYFHDYYHEDGGTGNGYTALNIQSSIGRALILMYKVSSDYGFPKSDYLWKARWIGQHIYDELHNPAAIEFTLLNLAPWYTWCHMPECGGNLWEDLSHAWLETELIELMVNHSIPTINGEQFNMFDIQKIANGLEFVMLQDPNEIKMNVYGTNNNCNQACPPDYTPDPVYEFEDQFHNISHSIFLTKYYNTFLNPSITLDPKIHSSTYQALSDLYSPNQILNGKVNNIFDRQNGNVAAVLVGLSQLTYYEQLFNPISVKPGTIGVSDLGLSQGNFGNMGNQFAVLKKTSGVPNISTFSIDANNNFIEKSNTNFPSNNLKFLAAGDLNHASPGDELVTIDLTNSRISAYEVSVSGTVFNTHSQPIAASNVAGISVGEFDEEATGSEILVATIDGNINMYRLNETSGFIDPIPLSPTSSGYSSISGIATGDFDGNNLDDFAIIDNLGNLSTYSMGFPSFFYETSTVLIPDAGNNSITSGDFDGDGIDEIMLHNGTTGAMQIYILNSSILNLKGGELFPTNQGNGSMCSMKLDHFPLSDALIMQRTFDGQISVLNLDGLCPNLYLNNQIINESTSFDNLFNPGTLNTYPTDYHVNNIILAGNEYEIASGGIVEMTAGKAIVFTPGFTASAGSDLHAYIDPGIACTTPTFRKATPPAPPPIAVTNPVPTINNLSIVPNPNNGNFKIDFTLTETPEKLTLTVTNSMGQLISSQEIYNADGSVKSAEVNLAGQPNGIYIVTLSATNFMQSKRFTIVNNE